MPYKSDVAKQVVRLSLSPITSCMPMRKGGQPRLPELPYCRPQQLQKTDTEVNHKVNPVSRG